jgi:hypothetical protein
MWSPTRDGYTRVLRRDRHGFDDPGDYTFIVRHRRSIPREYLQRFYAHWRHRHVTHRRV